MSDPNRSDLRQDEAVRANYRREEVREKRLSGEQPSSPQSPAKRPHPFLLSGAPRWWNNLLRFGCLFVEKLNSFLMALSVELKSDPKASCASLIIMKVRPASAWLAPSTATSRVIAER